MACRKNLDVAQAKNNKFPQQEKLWELIYRRGTLLDAARAVGRDPVSMSKVLDGVYDLKWSFVKALCEYLEIDNPLEVIL